MRLLPAHVFLPTSFVLSPFPPLNYNLNWQEGFTNLCAPTVPVHISTCSICPTALSESLERFVPSAEICIFHFGISTCFSPLMSHLDGSTSMLIPTSLLEHLNFLTGAGPQSASTWPRASVGATRMTLFQALAARFCHPMGEPEDKAT